MGDKLRGPIQIPGLKSKKYGYVCHGRHTTPVIVHIYNCSFIRERLITLGIMGDKLRGPIKILSVKAT